MAEYQFLLEDVMTGFITADDVDINPGCSFNVALNRAGGIRATLSMDSPFATEALITEGRTALYVMRDGKIEQGGIVWDATPSSGGVLDLTVDGWLGYFDHQIIETDRVFTATEQFDIVSTLVADLQDEGVHGDGFDLGITVGWDAPSGVLRDRVDDYRPWHRKNLGEAIRQLAAVEDGFDMAMTYTVSGDRIIKELRLYHPTKGRDTGHLFEYDAPIAMTDPYLDVYTDTYGAPGLTPSTANILAYKYPRSARQMAWSGTGWGDGTNEMRLQSPFLDESKRGIYPPMVGAPTFSGVTVQTTLDEHVGAYFATAGDPIRVPVVTVDSAQPPVCGDYVIGDPVHLRIDDRYTQIAAGYRITGFDMDVDTDTPSLTFADA